MAKRLACLFVSREIIPESQKDVSAYGLELIFSTLLNGVLVFTFAIGFGLFLETVLTLIPFMLIRSKAGGYHAKTHVGCASGFLFVYLIGMAAMSYIPTESATIIMGIMVIVSAAIVLIIGLAPHKNRPLSRREFWKFRFQARCLASTLSLIGLVGLYIWPALFIYFSLGLFIAAGSLLTAWMINKRERGIRK